LRRLRDRWQPGDASLLEAVASKRVDSAAAQKGVEDKLADLQEETDPESLEELNEFSDTFDTLQAEWEEFHDSYESLENDQAELEPAAVLARIDELIGNFDAIIASVEDLPSADKAEDLADGLAAAADSQEMGLGELKSEIESLEEGSSRASAFDAFDDNVQDAEDDLKDTEKELKTLTKDDSAKDTAAVEDFSREFDELLESWNGFHRDLDDWLDSEGGCDRSEVIQTLGEMSLEFGRLADRVRDLPTASYLRPMGGLVVEAAEGEEEAFRVLRNTWRPFSADVYKALDRQRADAGRSRRQASVGVQELLDRFQVSP
jgi:predicted  nucleic acid-binding Zn-ribbon protein